MAGITRVDSTCGADRFGITVDYWTDEQSIAAWRDHAVRAHSREHWYGAFAVNVALMERAYEFRRPTAA